MRKWSNYIWEAKGRCATSSNGRDKLKKNEKIIIGSFKMIGSTSNLSLLLHKGPEKCTTKSEDRAKGDRIAPRR
jgi:hypothetical protein